jgi:CRISPR/Cas system-associated protein Cas10 (large subunit of type III CRISPR-Cas system)
MSGVKDKTITGKEKSITVHQQQLMAMNMTNNCDINYVLDRSFLSEFLYANLGYKPYSYSEEEMEKDFENILRQLNACFKVIYVFLEPSDEVLKERLKRDKAEYQTFSLESSIKQKEFLREVQKMDLIKNSERLIFSNESLEEIVDRILAYQDK